jgi:N-acetylmuramoyl-L-alanine amidase
MVAKAFTVSDSTLEQPVIQVLDKMPLYNVPENFNPLDALRIIGYDIRNPEAAIKAFKLHFIQKEVNAQLTDADKKILHNLYKKYM